MRNAIVNVVVASALAATALAGCKWTDFDDLEDETWVTSRTTPSSVDSADYATTVIRGALSGPGSTTVVLGASHPTYSQIEYDGSGAQISTDNTVFKLDDATYGLPSVTGAIAIADPTGNDVSIVASGGANFVDILTGTTTPNEQEITGPAAPSAATYVATTANPADPTVMVAAPNNTASVLFTLDTVTKNQSSCPIVDKAGAPVPVAAIATLQNTTTGATYDDILVLTKPTSGTAQLLVYDGSAVTKMCAMQAPAGAPVDSGVDVSSGADLRILRLADSSGTHEYALIAAHGDAGSLSLFDMGTTGSAAADRAATAIGTQPAVGLAAIDLATYDAQPYVIAGFPEAVVGGTQTGQVQVSTIDVTPATAAPFGASPAMLLNDAQPDSDETFGRSVAAVPFGTAGTPIIVVAAHNEVFTYFHTALYPDVRSN